MHDCLVPPSTVCSRCDCNLSLIAGHLQPSLTADLLPNYLRLAERLLNGDCSELGFLRDWQRIGALRERVVHLAGGAAPLGERDLDAPRALGDKHRLAEKPRTAPIEFGRQ